MSDIAFYKGSAAQEGIVNMMREFYLNAIDGLRLSCALYENANPKALIQIIHGAKEHKARYHPFMENLASLGMAVITSDNRGHGHSVNEKYPLGHMDGWEIMVEDQMVITNHIKSLYPGAPLYMFAHSFGSVLARCYLQNHDSELEKLVLSGTAAFQSITGIGIPLGTIITRIDGKTGHNQLMQRIGDSDDIDWICSNPAVLLEIKNDPLCSGYKYTNSAILTIWKADRQLHSYASYGCKNPMLQVLSATGADDPIPGGQKRLADTERTLSRIGYGGFHKIVYPNMRHEIINEINKEIVYQDIVAFLNEPISNHIRYGRV